MSETYLILHKVSGEPAFDIAHKLETTGQNGEEMWIVSTSGHRAYPVEKWRLSLYTWPTVEDAYPIPEIPPNWPDHYNLSKDAIEPSAGKQKIDLGQLLSSIIPKSRRLIRRI